MEILIKYGFQKVTHNVMFQPESFPKGIKLVKAGHVVHAVERRVNGVSTDIVGRVFRTVNVNLEPYTVKLSINESRVVTGTSCSCVYKNSGKCKHVAALIHYINIHDSISKTAIEQQWGQPSARKLAQEKYSKGKYMFEMFPPRERKKNVARPRPVCASELQDTCPLKIVLLSESKGECELAVENLMQDMLDAVECNLTKEECASSVKTLLKLTVNFPVYSTEHQLDINLVNFYKRNILLTEEEIIQLCCDTLDQYKSNTWFEARKVRLSASKAVHSVKSRITKTEESLVRELLFPTKFESASTKYGLMNESKAREEYEKLYSVCVKQVGVMVSKNQPWLCASVDGLVYKGENLMKIVEIKCPSTCEKKPIIDWDLKKSNVSHLQVKESKVLLRTSSIYYTQCQTQMYVCGLNTCDLFFYSPVPASCVTIVVNRNEEFLKNVILKCEVFYFQTYLPAVFKHSSSKTQSSTRSILEDISNQF